MVRADNGTLETAIELSGNLAPETRVDIRSKLPGTLDKVLVQLGAAVTEGQTLATLDRREIDAQVDAAVAAVAVVRAGVDAADAAFENAGQEVERARGLYEKGAIPKQRLEAAEMQWRASKAQRDLAAANVEQANAALRRAREMQRDATLRAPVAGVIVARNFDAGSLVGPGGDPIMAVADLRTLKLEAGVSELEAGRLKAGALARVTVQAQPGQVFEGRVAAVAPEVDARNRHFRVEIRVANKGGAMLSGMYATARIPTATAEGPDRAARSRVRSRRRARRLPHPGRHRVDCDRHRRTERRQARRADVGCAAWRHDRGRRPARSRRAAAACASCKVTELCRSTDQASVSSCGSQIPPSSVLSLPRCSSSASWCWGSCR